MESETDTKQPKSETKPAKTGTSKGKSTAKKAPAKTKTAAKKKAPTKKKPAKGKSGAKKAPSKKGPAKKAAPKKEEENTALLIDPKKKRGRPPKKPTPKILEQVTSLASRGLHDYEIAIGIGWNKSEFSSKKSEYPELTEAIEEGRAIARANMINAVYEMGLKGNINAAKYWLNNKDPENWKDRREVGVENLTPREISEEEMEQMDDEELEKIANSENVVLIKKKKEA